MRIFRVVVAIAALAALVVPVSPARGESGTIIRRLYAGNNVASFKVHPQRDSGAAHAYGDAWTRENCSNFGTTFNVHVEARGFRKGTAYIGKIKFTGNHYSNRVWYSNSFDTAYFRPRDGKFVAGPRLGPRTFGRGRYNSFTLDFDRRIKLTRNTKWLDVRFVVHTRGDATDTMCWINVNPVFYKRR